MSRYLICPGTEEGYACLRNMLFKVLDAAAEIGVDYMAFWSYNEGCCCERGRNAGYVQ